MSDVELAISLPKVYQNPSERKHDENGAVLTPQTCAETVLCDIQNYFKSPERIRKYVAWAWICVNLQHYSIALEIQLGNDTVCSGGCVITFCFNTLRLSYGEDFYYCILPFAHMQEFITLRKCVFSNALQAGHLFGAFRWLNIYFNKLSLCALCIPSFCTWAQRRLHRHFVRHIRQPLKIWNKTFPCQQIRAVSLCRADFCRAFVSVDNVNVCLITPIFSLQKRFSLFFRTFLICS